MRNGLMEIRRRQSGLDSDNDLSDFDFSRPLSNVQTSGTVNQPLVFNQLAHGVADHAVTLSKPVPVGTVLSVYGLPRNTQLAVVLSLAPVTKFTKVYVRWLTSEESKELITQYPNLTPVSVASAQMQPISQTEGNLISILRAVDQIKTLFLQALLYFWLLLPGPKDKESSLFVRTYTRVLVLAFLLFFVMFVWLVVKS